MCNRNGPTIAVPIPSFLCVPLVSAKGHHVTDIRQTGQSKGFQAVKSCRVVYHKEQVELVVQVPVCQGGHKVLSHSLGFTLGIAKLCTR